MGGESTPSRAQGKSAGRRYRIKAPFLKEDSVQPAPVLHLLLRYTQALIPDAQTAVSNRHHSLDQQVCRWLP
jgi:hypothetical protein